MTDDDNDDGWLSLVSLGLGTLLLALFAWAAVGTAAPMLWGWQPTVIVSGSMLPGIRPGDVVEVAPGSTDLRVGEVVTFQSPDVPGKVITHRLRSHNADGTWVTKGDANPSADSVPVPAQNIIGRPKLLIPFTGLPTVWRSTGQPGKIIAVVALVILGLALARTGPSRTGSVRLAAQAPGR